VRLLADPGPAASSETHRLTTSVVSVNAKEDKTRKENHILGNFEELVDLDCLEFELGKSKRNISTRQSIHSEQREQGRLRTRDAPGPTMTTVCHSRRLLRLHALQAESCYI
jgi:hypothetical protein